METTALVKTGEAAQNHELIQLVSFCLDNEEYAVEVLKVREIIRMPEITRMPNTPNYAEGIINLRGKVIPVISMRKKFGLCDSEYSRSTRIVVTDISTGLTGFIVDSVSEVIRIYRSEIQPPPSAVAADKVSQEYICGVINRSDRMLIFLDMENVVPMEDM